MAVEQSGAQSPAGPAPADAAPADAAPADAAPAAADPPSGERDDPGAAQRDLDEMKRKFREALERKRGTHAAGGAEGAHDTGKVHGSHGPAASRRSFRRKSGG